MYKVVHQARTAVNILNLVPADSFHCGTNPGSVTDNIVASINWNWWISTEISGLLAGIKFMLLFLAAVAGQQNEWIYLFSFEVHWCQFLDDYVATTGLSVCVLSLLRGCDVATGETNL